MWKSIHHDQIKLWNPITKYTPLNNYLSNCVITWSYTSNYRGVQEIGKRLEWKPNEIEFGTKSCAFLSLTPLEG
jgi:hypothetical protein